jgi:hypothetical protein
MPKSLKSRILDGTGTIFVFLSAGLGAILADRYLSGIEGKFHLKDAALGLVGAVFVVGKNEFKDGDLVGKKSNLWSRLINAFSHGALWRMAGGIIVGSSPRGGV